MNISAYRADYLPLLGQLIDQMKLPQIINDEVTKPNSQAILYARTVISGMILNLLSDAKIRLYRLSYFFEDKPMPLIFPWNPKITPSNQKSFNSLTSEGWRPKVISVASVGGKLHYTALYTKQAIGRFEARSFLTPDEYQTKFNQNKASGRHPRYLNSYLHKGKLRFSAIWARSLKCPAI